MRLSALLLLALMLPGLAAAADPAAFPPALKRLQDQGGAVGPSFPGPDGLTGWVVKLSGRSFIAYTTASGDYAISGILVDKDGNNLTQQYAQLYIPRPSPADMVAKLEQDPMLVDEGDAKAPIIYVYADANCIFCNRFWNELRPYLQAGKVRVRWAMLAFLKESSVGRAAAILATKDRTAALALDETRFDKDKEEGGIAPLHVVPDALRTELLLHTSQMMDIGGQGTPLILYHQADGWHQVEGLPPDMAKFIGGLTTVGSAAH